MGIKLINGKILCLEFIAYLVEQEILRFICDKVFVVEDLRCWVEHVDEDEAEGDQQHYPGGNNVRRDEEGDLSRRANKLLDLDTQMFCIYLKNCGNTI